MFKVLIWDYTGTSRKWLEQFAEIKDIEFVGAITPSKPTPEILLKQNAWDWLLIFEQGARNFFEATIQILNLPLDKVIYALDMSSWVQHPKAIYTLLNEMGEGAASIHMSLNINRRLNNYATCTVEGLSYVATSKDNYVMPPMYIRGENHAAGNMKIFQALAKKYYNVDDNAGYFLDLGANIGTTGIYFTTKLAPNLKLLSFEPDPENFKLHRINLLLNDISDDKAIVVNCGLGDKFDEVTMYRSLENPGGNGMYSYLRPKQKDFPTETIKTIPLDSYLAENKIAASDIKYIWIDTEGFEAQVLLGAKNLLKENPAPIFMECNLRAWDNSGCFEDMMTLLAEGYSHFIHFYNGEKLYPLDALRTMERPNNDLGQIGDIFLIRHGAID